MRTFGFSTRAVAKGDFRTAIARTREATAGYPMSIELSALRASELDPLLDAFAGLDLTGFAYVSLHGPSRLDGTTEHQVQKRLQAFLVNHRVNVVMHPDTLCDVPSWRVLGPQLCLENMDNRDKQPPESLATGDPRVPRSCTKHPRFGAHHHRVRVRAPCLYRRAEG
jgi:hypothetical protein